jgi:hypothetical protein
MSSQGREDAILARIFATIGTTNQYAVEFGARDGVGLSNTEQLRKQGWTCLLLDAHPRSSLVRKAFLTAGNINQVFEAYGVPKVFDLLSIDVDGNDFWLWKALEDYRPRVVVIEYNSTFGPDQSVVMPYRADHVWDKTSYYGASAAALAKLGREKGYSLVDYVPRTNLVFVEDTAMLPRADPCRYPTVDRRWELY